MARTRSAAIVGSLSAVGKIPKIRKEVKKMRNIIEKSNKLMHSWNELAPQTVFAGLTLEGFRAIVEPVVDIRASIEKADQDRVAAAIRRDAEEKALGEKYLRVVSAIKAAPEHGEDSPLYGAIGYIVRSAKQSGLSRAKKTEPETVLAE
jgi:hypothetical protein